MKCNNNQLYDDNNNNNNNNNNINNVKKNVTLSPLELRQLAQVVCVIHSCGHLSGGDLMEMTNEPESMLVVKQFQAN